MSLTEKELSEYLADTEYFNYSHPNVATLVEQIADASPKQMAIYIYNLVRDGYAYNPYVVVDGTPSLGASYLTEKGQGYCIPKASLMIAMCRAKGIPARIGLADVTNHLSSPRLVEMLKTDIFTMHGYVEVYLNDKWIKATPAFNKSLCEKMNTHVLEFDGENDSVFQEFSPDGEKHMEYLIDWGTYAEVPADFIMYNLNKHYPHLMDRTELASGGALETE